ncbi:GntR family transcriptional regulator [Parapedobacter sp.]
MDFKDNKAIYLQISDYVFEHILLGRWQAAEKIPSVRELAAALEVNPNTVARTYELLQNQQIIQNKRGVGFFVTNDAIAKTRAIRRQEFMDKELPVFFRTIYLLDIDIEQLKHLYENFVNTTFQHENK